jgi:hypothetical protein
MAVGAEIAAAFNEGSGASSQPTFSKCWRNLHLKVHTNASTCHDCRPPSGAQFYPLLCTWSPGPGGPREVLWHAYTRTLQQLRQHAPSFQLWRFAASWTAEHALIPRTFHDRATDPLAAGRRVLRWKRLICWLCPATSR